MNKLHGEQYEAQLFQLARRLCADAERDRSIILERWRTDGAAAGIATLCRLLRDKPELISETLEFVRRRAETAEPNGGATEFNSHLNDEAT